MEVGALLRMDSRGLLSQGRSCRACVPLLLFSVSLLLLLLLIAFLPSIQLGQGLGWLSEGEGGERDE